MINLKGHSKSRLLIWAAVILLLAYPVSSALLGNRFWQHLLFMIFLTAALTGSYNILAGFAGQLSLGHSVFFGIGAYTSTLLLLNYHISPWLGMIAASILATAAAIIIGYPCFRLRGPFFSLATLAVGQMALTGAIEWRGLTSGANGLNVMAPYGIGNLMFSSKITYMLIALGLMLMVVLINKKIGESRMGYYLIALREDEDAAEALGINTVRMKVIALIISGVLTAIMGVIYAQYIWYIEPSSVFSEGLSLQWVIMAVVGGIGTVWGPILGAFLLVPLNEFIRIIFGAGIQGLHLVIYAVLLILVVILMPRGIIAFVERFTLRSKGENG